MMSPMISGSFRGRDPKELMISNFGALAILALVWTGGNIYYRLNPWANDVKEAVRIDAEGNTVNRLEVDWYSEEWYRCATLRQLYGEDAAANVVIGNMERVLALYPHSGISQGFLEITTTDQPTQHSAISSSSLSYFLSRLGQSNVGEVYVRESTESPETLSQIGKAILDTACDEPLEKQGFHQRFEPHKALDRIVKAEPNLDTPLYRRTFLGQYNQLEV